jgi:hypothetical protein
MKEHSGVGSRFYHLCLIRQKKKKETALLKYELDKIENPVLEQKVPLHIRDILIRTLYIQIIMIFLILVLKNNIIPGKTFFFVKDRSIIYNEYTRNPAKLFVKTYSDTIKLNVKNNGKEVGNFKVNNNYITLNKLKEGKLTLECGTTKKILSVEVLKAVEIADRYEYKESDNKWYKLEANSAIKGTKIRYIFKISGKYDQFLLKSNKKKLNKLNGIIRLDSDVKMKLQVYNGKYLVGEYERYIKSMENNGPIVEILKPKEDEEIDSFYGDYPIKYRISDREGIDKIYFVYEKELQNTKKKIQIKNHLGKKYFTSNYNIRLDEITTLSDRLLYFYIEAYDVYGEKGESQHFTLSLFDKNDIREIFENIGNDLFGELKNGANDLEKERLLKKMQKEGNTEKFQRTVKKNIKKNAETIKKTADYLKAEMEQLKIEDKIIEQFKKQMDLIRELLDENVMKLLESKLERSMNKNDSSEKKLSQEDLKKIAFELERIVKKLEEYKKGLDAKKIAEKLDQLKFGEEKKLENVKKDANELFSKFDDKDKKMLDPDMARLNLEKMKNEKQQSKFNQKKNQLSKQFKQFSKNKLNEQNNNNPDLMPLVKNSVSIDFASQFAKEDESFISSKLKNAETEIQKYAAILLMMNYNLYKKFENAKENYKRFQIKKEGRYFTIFKNNYSQYMNELLKLLDQMNSCSCNSSNSMNLFQKLNELAKDQSQLNSYLEKLMEQLKNSELNKRLSRALDQAGKHQEEIKKGLEELEKEIEKGKEKGEMVGDTKNIKEDMEDLKKEILKKKATGDIPKKGRKIVIKLLDLQRSMYQRKEENIRYSQMGKFIQKWYPNKLKKQKPTRTYLNDYKDLIKEYNK